MYRFLLGIAFTLLAGTISYQVASGQDHATADEQRESRRVAARKTLDEAILTASPLVESVASQLIEQREVQLNALRSRTEAYGRAMRAADRSPGIAGARLSSSGRRAGVEAEVNSMDVDADRISKSIENLKREHELNILRAAWITLNHEVRMEIVDSGCLTDDERQLVLSVVDVKKIDAEKSQNSVGITLRKIQPGEFKMGASGNSMIPDQPQVRLVTISDSFWIAETEVTQKQYAEVMGENPSSFKSSGIFGFLGSSYARHPVEGVNWYDAVRFCRELSGRPEEIGAGRRYRLPTEAEWEYACRGGTTSSFNFGSFTSVKGTEANINWKAFGSQATENATVPVGRYAPNAYGLFDMHGNVSEWCSDWYSGTYYSEAPDTDPPGPAMGDLVRQYSLVADLPRRPVSELKVTRGGAFNHKVVQDTCLSSARTSNDPAISAMIGIRIVCEDMGQPSAILLDQYQTLADFEIGKPRTALLNAQKEYRSELKIALESLLRKAKKLEKGGDSNMVRSDERISTYGGLSCIYQSMAEEYERVGDKDRCAAAYIEAGNWSLKEATAFAPGSPDADPNQREIRLLAAARKLASGGDLTRAQEILDQDISIHRESSTPRVQEIIDRRKKEMNP